MSQPEFQFQTKAKQKWFVQNYNRAAWFYEKSAQLYSGNLIANSKRHQLEFIEPNSKTIFLGVGAGEDALQAVEKGADVTCVDISEGMLDKLDARLQKKGLKANLVCQSALEHKGSYDVCCANFFLNMFKEPDMRLMLSHAATLVRTRGRLMIADVAADDESGWVRRSLSLCYRKFAMINFYLLGLVEFHQDYDYRIYLPELGFRIDEAKPYRLFGVGPIVFRCIVATKTTDK